MKARLAFVVVLMLVAVFVAPQAGSNRPRDKPTLSPFPANNPGGTVVATIPVGNNPYGVAYDGGNGYVYVANSNPCANDMSCGTGRGYGNLSVVSGTRVVATIPLGDGTAPRGIAYDSKNGYVYVANSYCNPFCGSAGTVSVIRGTTVVATITIGNAPNGVAYDNGNGFVYVANSDCMGTGCGRGSVTVINGTSVVATVPAGNQPEGVGYDSGNGYIYVANAGSNSVSVISGITAIANVTVGTAPYAVAHNSGNGLDYVANAGSNSFSVIRGTVAEATYPLGNGANQPFGVAYDPRNEYVYVTSFGSNMVGVIDGSTVIATVNVGSSPIGLAYNADNSYVYVANSGSNTVSVIRPEHPPIAIHGNSQFTAANGVSSGTGSASDPYIIENVNITVPCTGYNCTGTGLVLQDTTAYFIIRNVNVNDLTYAGGDAFELLTVANGRVYNSTFSGGEQASVDILSSTGISFVGNNLRIFQISNSKSLTFYHNNIYQPPQASLDYLGVGDVFDNGYPSGGNYWSDYTGSDHCRGPQQNDCTSPDGIGDTPYSYNGILDHYPLMTAFPGFSISTNNPVLRFIAGTGGTPIHSGIVVSGTDGFSGNITLNAAPQFVLGDPLILTPSTHSLGNGVETFTSDLKVLSSPSAPPGTYTITVTATSGGVSHAVSITAIVDGATWSTFNMGSSRSRVFNATDTVIIGAQVSSLTYTVRQIAVSIVSPSNNVLVSRAPMTPDAQNPNYNYHYTYPVMNASPGLYSYYITAIWSNGKNLTYSNTFNILRVTTSAAGPSTVTRGASYSLTFTISVSGSEAHHLVLYADLPNGQTPTSATLAGSAYGFSSAPSPIAGYTRYSVPVSYLGANLPIGEGGSTNVSTQVTLKISVSASAVAGQSTLYYHSTWTTWEGFAYSETPKAFQETVQ